MCLKLVAPSVWRIGSGRPRAAVLGGVHGNERVGIEVVHRLREQFSRPAAASTVRGELTLALGNPDASDRGVRFVATDLNRCFGGSPGAGRAGLQGERGRAAELAPYLADLDLLLDLHSTNKPSSPFVRLPGAVSGALFGRCEELFLSLLPPHCRTVLWDPGQGIAGGAMTDEFALRHGPRGGQGAYVCYESGLASDVAAVPSTEAAVNASLVRAGVVSGEAGVGSPGRAWGHFQIFDVVTLDERGFEWANGHGGKNFDRVAAGEAYGRRGCGGPVLVAPEEAYIVFPKVEHLWAHGKPLGWLARRIPDPSTAAPPL